MGRGILLWLLGVPIPIIILLAIFYREIEPGKPVRVERAGFEPA
jgi:hypothetical protein